MKDFRRKAKVKADIIKRLEQCLEREGNQTCADCPEKNPTWASLLVPALDLEKKDKKEKKEKAKKRKMGIFCCYKCCSYHFQLGREVCEVKNIKVADEWTSDDVKAMEYSGNALVNSIYEASMEESEMNICNKDKWEEQRIRSLLVERKYKKREFFDANAYQEQMKLRKDEKLQKEMYLISLKIKEAKDDAAVDTAVESDDGKTIAKTNHSDPDLFASDASTSKRYASMTRSNANATFCSSSRDKAPIRTIQQITAASLDLGNLDFTNPATVASLLGYGAAETPTTTTTATTDIDLGYGVGCFGRKNDDDDEEDLGYGEATPENHDNLAQELARRAMGRHRNSIGGRGSIGAGPRGSIGAGARGSIGGAAKQSLPGMLRHNSLNHINVEDSDSDEEGKGKVPAPRKQRRHRSMNHIGGNDSDDDEEEEKTPLPRRRLKDNKPAKRSLSPHLPRSSRNRSAPSLADAERGLSKTRNRSANSLNALDLLEDDSEIDKGSTHGLRRRIKKSVSGDGSLGYGNSKHSTRSRGSSRASRQDIGRGSGHSKRPTRSPQRRSSMGVPTRTRSIATEDLDVSHEPSERFQMQRRGSIEGRSGISPAPNGPRRQRRGSVGGRIGEEGVAQTEVPKTQRRMSVGGASTASGESPRSVLPKPILTPARTSSKKSTRASSKRDVTENGLDQKSSHDKSKSPRQRRRGSVAGAEASPKTNDSDNSKPKTRSKRRGSVGGEAPSPNSSQKLEKQDSGRRVDAILAMADVVNSARKEMAELRCSQLNTSEHPAPLPTATTT